MENNNVESNQAKTKGILSQNTQQQQQLYDIIDSVESCSYNRFDALRNEYGADIEGADKQYVKNQKLQQTSDDVDRIATTTPPTTPTGVSTAVIDSKHGDDDDDDKDRHGKSVDGCARSDNNICKNVNDEKLLTSSPTTASTIVDSSCYTNKLVDEVSCDILNIQFDGPKPVENFSLNYADGGAASNPFRPCSYCSRCNQFSEKCLCDTQNESRKYSNNKFPIDVGQNETTTNGTQQQTTKIAKQSISEPNASECSNKNISIPNRISLPIDSNSSHRKSGVNETPIEQSNQTGNRLASSRLAYLPAHIRNLPKTQSLDLGDAEIPSGLLAQQQPYEHNRTIYPNVPFSPYGSPFGSPRANRRCRPLRESRRISIEKSGSFLQLNQYKLLDQIGQVSFDNKTRKINFSIEKLFSLKIRARMV